MQSFSVFVFLILLLKVHGSGVFQVLLTSLTNDKGMTSRGDCCYVDGDSGRCTQQCRTFVTVCLMHYQNRVVKTYPSCTFGQFATHVLGGNNLDLREETGDGPYVVKLPFSFTWPESFTLIVEVWHDEHRNRSVQEDRLILRVERTDSILPLNGWRMEQEGNLHSELTFSYRVICDENYFGNACDRFCRARDDKFGHYTCSPNGTKQCLEGWKGRFCDQAECHERCNSTHGFCDSPVKCRCRLGWKGEFCEECVKSPDCNYGYCHVPWQCICHEGWTGINCDIDAKFCQKHQPCLNGGSCITDWRRNFTCKCPPGFKGENCETTSCTDQWCQNGGSCQEDGFGLVCKCPHGYTGEHCEKLDVNCSGVICHNNGSCIIQDNKPKCVCPELFTGNQCEQFISQCTSQPCHNGGTCEDAANRFRCKCTPRYTGQYCESEVNLCENVHCQNDGNCTIIDYQAQCECQTGYRGTLCENPIDRCPRSFCANGGLCEESENGRHCVCRHSFRGKTCRIAVSSCSRTSCSNSTDCVTTNTNCDCKNKCPRISPDPLIANINHLPVAPVISGTQGIITSAQSHIIVVIITVVISGYSLPVL